MILQILPRFAACVVCLIVVAWTGTSRASMVEIGTGFSTSGTVPASGDTVSAAVHFYYDSASPKTLIIDLVNTTSKTLSPADALVGLAFNISGSPVYATAPATHNLTPSLTLTGLGVTSTKLGSGSFSETWTNKYTPGGNSKVTGAYGISTNGFSGAFNGNGLGSENNGIVGAGTTLSNGFNSESHQPLAVSGLEIKLAFKSIISGATISGVQFLFGTSGTGVLGGVVVPPTGGPHVNPAVPEPSSIAAFGIGLIGLAIFRRRRRSA